MTSEKITHHILTKELTHFSDSATMGSADRECLIAPGSSLYKLCSLNWSWHQTWPNELCFLNSVKVTKNFLHSMKMNKQAQ